MITLRVLDSIQRTINSIPKDHVGTVRIIIPKGVHKERVDIEVPRLIIEGEGMEETVIRENYHASEIFSDGTRRGTFRSYTMRIDAEDVEIRNLTVENSSGDRKRAEQSMALYADGEGFRAVNCRIMSEQDTLFIGPLPKKEIHPGGFQGPGELKERKMLHQFYKDCEIIGDVDFIFGSGAAYFENCMIRSISEENFIEEFRKGNAENLGYVCAPSTYQDERIGFVFDSCDFVSNLPKRSVYLARPWRDYGKCVFLNCNLGEHIKEEGFHDWNKENARKNCFFAEYRSKGPGAEGKRADFAKRLSEEEAAEFSKSSFLNQ
ncbi:MAG: pectin methylesterase [Lachnospiraceae bacterium]|nr:pectin methylesterase [Lachnospiraceae bacterium]